MPVFISYSHADKDFVDRLAVELVRARAQVWVDRWELNVGDSLMARVQEAVQDADALLVVLSPASVASEWCKRELTAGLFRELEERRVVVLPLLLRECEIPLFLRDKLYADFRNDFNSGLQSVLRAVSRVINDTRSRIESPQWHTDWAFDWGIDDGGLRVVLTFVEQAVDRPYTVQTIVTALGNDSATRRYEAYIQADLGWVFTHIVTEALAEAVQKQDLRMVLGNSNPHLHHLGISDVKTGIQYRVRVECRLLGEDTGSDVVVDIANLLSEVRKHMLRSSRSPSKDEIARMDKLLRELNE